MMFKCSLASADCCSAVVISTAGAANATQFVRLGVYHVISNRSYASRPVYSHAEREEFLFYVPGRARGLWMVGPSVGRFSGGLANRGDEACANDVSRQWKFADVDGWKTDPELKITCANVTDGEYSGKYGCGRAQRKEIPERRRHVRRHALLLLLLLLAPRAGRAVVVAVPRARASLGRENAGGNGRPPRTPRPILATSTAAS